MRFKIQCTFNCEVEAADMEAAFAEVSDILLINNARSDAVVHCDEHYEIEAWEMEVNQ